MKSSHPSHVLVVDDSEPCLRICQIVLEQAVTPARSVPEALLALGHQMPDALVCDLLLGSTGTGFDVVAAVRAADADVFCIAVTGLATREIQEKALGTGFDEFLYKPYKPSRLVELLGTSSKS
jgi:CheY-like chemotaxis protein